MFAELQYLFPNSGLVLMSLGWIALVCVVSSLMNGQTVSNKLANGAKTLGFALLLLSWVYAAGYYAGIKPTMRAATFAFSGWLLFEIGDWLSFLLYILKMSPGGPGGWMWRKLAVLFLKLHTHSARAAERSLRPTERRLIEIHQSAKETKAVDDKIAEGKMAETADPKVSALAGSPMPAPAPSEPPPADSPTATLTTQEGS